MKEHSSEISMPEGQKVQALPQAGRSLTLHFQVSYMTEWGQSVKVVGEGALLGSWNPIKGHAMNCRHVGASSSHSPLLSVILRTPCPNFLLVHCRRKRCPS